MKRQKYLLELKALYVESLMEKEKAETSSIKKWLIQKTAALRNAMKSVIVLWVS